MDTNDSIKVLRSSQEQLNHVLNECQNGPSELVLFASKMSSLLEDFSAAEAALLSSVSKQQEEISGHNSERS